MEVQWVIGHQSPLHVGDEFVRGAAWSTKALDAFQPHHKAHIGIWTTMRTAAVDISKTVMVKEKTAA